LSYKNAIFQNGNYIEDRKSQSRVQHDLHAVEAGLLTANAACWIHPSRGMLFPSTDQSCFGGIDNVVLGFKALI